MIKLDCHGAPRATARLLPSLAAPPQLQPRHVRRHRLLSEMVQQHRQACRRLLAARATGFGTAQPVGEHYKTCVRTGGNLASRSSEHVSISPLRSRFVEVLQVMQQRASARLCHHAAGPPAVMTAGVAQQLEDVAIHPGQRQWGVTRSMEKRAVWSAAVILLCLSMCR
jgi:hypothetical protein